jgi:hypothetical protein
MIETFRVGRYAMRYGHFVPRLYNYCRSLGFERQRMLPSRAFCSDESQGYPVMLLAQHFGTFPFDHGRVGGKVAINRHGPYAHHGEDLVLIQASHVGYNPDDGRFGVYQRHRTEGCRFGDCCGKLCGVRSLSGSCCLLRRRPRKSLQCRPPRRRPWPPGLRHRRRGCRWERGPPAFSSA